MTVQTRPSKKQFELLRYIEKFIGENGYGPSYREIMRALDYRSVSTVAIHINGLISRGHLVKRDRSARSLEVVHEPAEMPTLSPSVGDENVTWLTGTIDERFEAYEKSPSIKAKDDLYVLVGALHVLGLKEPAKLYKARLSSLAKKAS